MKLNDILEPKNSYILTEMPYEDAKEIEHVLKHVLKQHLNLTFDSSGHFIGRIVPNDEIPSHRVSREMRSKNLFRERDVSKEDFYSTFKKFIRQHGRSVMGEKQFGKELEGTIMDSDNNLNIGFKINYQFRDRFPLFRIVTVHKRRGFQALRGTKAYRV